MYYLIIDTCIWINITKDINNSTLDILVKMANENKVKILLPTMVQEEWVRNKNAGILKPALESHTDSINNIKKISKFLKGEVKEQFSLLMNDIMKSEEEFKKCILERIIDVEELFNSKFTKRIPITNSVREKAIQLALNKEAPFKGKNSMGDALLLLSSVDYIKKHKIYPAFFITENKEDFSSNPKNQPDILHEDLKKYLDVAKIEYYTNINKLLNEIEKNYVKDINSSEVSRELGILEELIDNPEIKAFTASNDKVLIERTNGKRESINAFDDIYGKRYDLNKCIEYFSNFVTYKTTGFEMCTLDDMEIVMQKHFRGIDVYLTKRERAITLSECNINFKIHSKFNNILYEMIYEHKNILILGHRNSQVHMILSAITSMFDPSWRIAMIEDRAAVNIQFGRIIYTQTVGEFKMEEIICELNKIKEIESEKTIFDVGNYNLKENVLPEILDCFSIRKGCIALHCFKSPDEVVDINYELSLRLGSKSTESMIKNIDYVIVVEDFIGYRGKGYLSRIWKQEQLKFKEVMSFNPLE